MADRFALSEAFIRIRPDDTGLKSEMNAAVKKAAAGLAASATLTLNADKAKAEAARMKPILADLGKRVSAYLNVDDAQARATAARMMVTLGRLDTFVAKPEVTIKGVTKALADVAAMEAGLDRLDAKAAESKAAVGLAGLSGPSGMGALIAAGVALSPVIATVGVGLGGLGLAAFQLSKNQALLKQTLAPLKSEYTAFSASLRPEVVSAFGTAVKIAGNLLHDVQPVAAATGKAFDQFLSEFGATLQDSRWQQFWGFMAKTAPGDVRLLGNTLLDLANALPPILEQLQPIAQAVLQVADATAKVAGAVATTSQRADPFLKKLTTQQQQLAAAPAGHGFVGWLEGTYINTVRSAENISAKLVHLIFPGLGDASDKTKAKMAGLNTQLQTRSADKVATQIENLKNQLIGANQPAGVINADMFVMQQHAQGAASMVSQLNSDWDTFIGQTQGMESSLIAVNQGLKTMQQDAGKAGASFTGLNSNSLTLQSDFNNNVAPSVQQIIDKMRTAHASSHDLGQVISTYLSPAVHDGALKNKALRTEIFDMAQEAGYAGPNKIKPLTDWINGNKTSLKNATDKANSYAQALGRIPSRIQTNINLVLHSSGAANLKTTGVFLGTGVGHLIGYAAGGRVFGSGSGDTVPAMLTPGEVVVPRGMVGAGAVDHLRGRLPGFAEGGLVRRNLTHAPGYPAQWMDQHASADARNFMSGAYNKFLAGALARIRNAVAAVNVGGTSGNVSSYGGLVTAILRRLEGPRFLPGDTSIALRQMQTESGGNPRAVNLSDSNAAAGHPSVGLMQVIRGTFDAYAGPYRNTGPFLYGVSINPAANIYAGLDYATHRYGAAWRRVLGQGHGYDSGGWLMPGLTLAYNGTGSPEWVNPPAPKAVHPPAGKQKVTVEFKKPSAGMGMDVHNALLSWILKTVRVNGGGNVQTAFGWSG